MKVLESISFQPVTPPRDTAATLKESRSCGPQPRKAALQVICTVCINLSLAAPLVRVSLCLLFIVNWV